MSSFTYTPLVGMTSQNDPKNNITYFNYDGFSRLANITDADKNILKEYTYNYGANPLVTGLYYNSEMSRTYRKQGCGSGYIGSQVDYTVPAGAYSSSVSLGDANQKAANDTTLNGQNYANIFGTCVSTATYTVALSLDAGMTINDIGTCSITIRDAGNNSILFSRTSSQMSFPSTASLAASSNGYYSVTIVPDPVVPLEGFVNSIMKDLYSSQTWTQVSGNISITLSNNFY